MFLTEKFDIETERKLYNWNQFECYKLKHKYENEHCSEVITYKLEGDELEKLLKEVYRNK